MTELKRISKRLIFPLISCFLAYRSFEIMKLIYYTKPVDLSIGVQLLLAALLVLFVTGIFAFVGFAYPTNLLLGNAYYHIKNKARLKKWYQFLHLELFRKFLLVTFWSKEQKRKQFFDGSKTGLTNLNYQTKQAEFGHLAAFVALVIISIFALFKSFFALALSCLILNVLCNLYPVILQRYHRMRLQKIQSVKT